MRARNDSESLKISMLIHNLLCENHSLESSILLWFKNEISFHKPLTLTDLYENTSHFQSLITSRKFKPELKNHPFFQNPNPQNLVKWESEIWSSLKNINIFSYLNKTLQEFFHHDFDFELNFSDVFYSEPEKIVMSLIIVTIMTIIAIHEETDGEFDFSILKVSDEFDSNTKITLTTVFRTIIDIFDLLSQDDMTSSALSQPSLQRSTSKFAKEEHVIFQKLEDLKMDNDQLTQKNKQLSQENDFLKEALTAKEHDMYDLDKQLNLTRAMYEDLSAKIKGKNLDLVNDEIKERDQKIKAFAANLKLKDDKMAAISLEFANLQDVLFKTENELKIAKLFVEEAASNRETSLDYNLNSEDARPKIATLETEVRNLERELVEERQRTVQHELKVNKLEQEIEKIEQQKLEIEGKFYSGNQNENVFSSLLFIQDFDDLLNEISSPEVINKVKSILANRENGTAEDRSDLLSTDGIKKRLGNSFEVIKQVSPGPKSAAKEVISTIEIYQSEVMLKFKTLLVELSDKRENLTRVLEDIEKMKDEIEELNFRADENQNKIVVDLLSKNERLRTIYENVENSVSQENAILSDLMKQITKKEAEITRLVFSRKRTQAEIVWQESLNAKCLELIYTSVVQFAFNEENSGIDSF